MNSLMGRLGAFTVRRRWYVIGAWMVLLAVMASFASGLTDRLGSGGFEVPGSQSLAVQRDLERRFANQFPTTALITVHDDARTIQLFFRDSMPGNFRTTSAATLVFRP